MLLVTAERMLFTTAEGYCCKQWNGGFFGSSNAVFNVARQSEPTKEEIGLSSLESPAAAGFEPMIKLLSLTTYR